MKTHYIIGFVMTLIIAPALIAQPPGRPQGPPGVGGPPREGNRPGQPGQPRPDAQPPGDWIKILDSNMNQILEADEFQAAIDRTFAELDKNLNGTIDPGEVGLAPNGDQRPRRPDQADGSKLQPERPGHNPPGQPDMNNGDGKRLLPPFFFERLLRQGNAVTKGDFERAAREVFSEMDKNHDGVIDKNEGRPPRDGSPEAGPPPPNAQFIGAELRFGDRLVKGQPFSADTVLEDTRRLYDGTTVTKKMSGAIYRDGNGRTRREQPLEMVGGYSVVGADNKPQMLVFIDDFAAKTQYFLNANNKVADRHPLNGNPPPDPPSPQNAKTESLGTKTVEGVACEGTRMTFEIPAGNLGNDKPLEVVTENWFSPELQMIVMSRHVDPLAGEHTFRLTNIKRAEPSADLFTVPSDYRIQGGGDKGRQ